MKSPTPGGRNAVDAAVISDGAIALGSAALRIDAGEVHVWRAALDEPGEATVRRLQTLLSSDERERARRCYFERDRRRFVVGRGILRTVLGRYLGSGGGPDDLVFRQGANGKPSLATTDGAPPPIFFNVTHSDGLALYAFTRAGEIGIDVERIRDLPDWEQIAAHSFSARETMRLRACAPEQRRDEFFRAWTRQEAVLKALGTGLGGERAGGDIATPARQSAAKRRVGNPPALSDTEFAVYPLNAARGFAAALAVNPAAVVRRPERIPGWEHARGGAFLHSARSESRSVDGGKNAGRFASRRRTRRSSRRTGISNAATETHLS